MKSDLGLDQFDHINRMITLSVITLSGFHCISFTVCEPCGACLTCGTCGTATTGKIERALRGANTAGLCQARCHEDSSCNSWQFSSRTCFLVSDNISPFQVPSSDAQSISGPKTC